MIGRRFVGHAYRAHDPAWSFLPASGAGAARRGGRFNRKGRPALYLSAQITTALMESQQGFAFKQPVTLCCYDIDCENIVDLTDKDVCDTWGIAESDLACAWFDLALNGQPVPSWDRAEYLIANGAAGAKVRSYCAGAGVDNFNLVFWDWGDALPRKVCVIDEFSRLPKTQASWV